ncbi:YtpI family protein [Paenibacillus athensensis]|uniref:YtpI-like protein n=1 Tax=Paenibacillus athensensis TaxID=1967502 RepID=A0A4Y8PW87_9BACL|nr:YtpI family protein [Paenibacillus athensensis]MCD1258876.1 YtpI family protein [Paenibacillus athensensis]
MLETVQVGMFLLIVLMLALSIYFSFRFRRERDPKRRGLFSARMNMCMGLMLVLLAVTQLFFFTDSTLRRTFGTIFLLIGLFNLFAGIRNYSHFQRMPE